MVKLPKKNKKIKKQETQLPIRLESFLPSPVSYSINFFFSGVNCGDLLGKS